MNGISVDPKQGLEANVLSFTGTGDLSKHSTEIEEQINTTGEKITPQSSSLSVISSCASGSVVSIQDGAEDVGSATDLVQLGNIPDPPVLSIPDTAADNETISRLLGGQGAALLELGSTDSVNIDFIQENVDFSQDTAIEELPASSPNSGAAADMTGVSPASHGELSAAVTPVPGDEDAKVMEGVQSSRAPVPVKVARALDLSLKSGKRSASELLGNIAGGIRAENLKNIQTSSGTLEAVSNNNGDLMLTLPGMIDGAKRIRTTAARAISPSTIISGLSFATKSSSVTSDTGSLQLTPESGTGTSDLVELSAADSAPLLLNVTPISSDAETDTASNTINSTSTTNTSTHSTNPLMYIITSRDKNTGITQRFRVTVDPESVMYIPVGNLSLNTTAASPSSLVTESAAPSTASKETNADPSPSDVTSVESDGLPVLLEVNEGGDASDGHDESSKLSATAAAVESIMTSQVASSAVELNSSGDGAKTRVNKQNQDDVQDKSKSQTWSKRNAQKKKEALEVITCDQPGCGAKITGKSKYRVHMLGHTGNRPYKCPHDDCDWTFPSLYKLRRHMSGHSGAKPFVCGMEGCGKQFSTIYNLKMHLNSHFRHTVEVCDYEGCGKIFNSVPLLKIHKRNHFEEQRLKCEFPGCSRTFTTSSALGSHQRVHVRDDTNYPCPFEGCGKVYDKACRLKLHMRSHTGERPFKCTYEGCDWAFTCIQKLTRHLVRHTGERKYQCKFEGCHKLFTRLEHLKSHEVFHSGEKPFACKEEGCNARFSARSSLYMHQKRHQQGKPMREKLLFSCPLDGCDMSFASKLGLKSHIIKGHGVPLPFTGGTGDLELIPLGSEQLRVSYPVTQTQPPEATTVAPTPTLLHITNTPSASSTSSQATTSLPTITLPTISTDLITSPILQTPGLVPASTASIPLSTLSTSRDEAASILASGLLQTQFILNPVTPTQTTTIPVTLTTSAKDTDTDQNPGAVTVTMATPPTTTPCPKVYQENASGCARTDFRAVSAKYPIPPEALENWKKMDYTDVDSLSQTESSGSSEGSLQATFIPVKFNTSASLTLRDPATGTRYIQTQLLQDDPPDVPDIGFHLTSHGSADQSPLNSSLSVSAMLDTTEAGSDHNSDTDFMTSDDVIPEDMVTSFRESTINLQDLE